MLYHFAPRVDVPVVHLSHLVSPFRTLLPVTSMFRPAVPVGGMEARDQDQRESSVDPHTASMMTWLLLGVLAVPNNVVLK